MDSETKEQKTKSLLSENFRCLLYAVVVVFLLSCIVFQAFLFMDHLEMKQRLAAIDNLTPKKFLTTNPPLTEARKEKLNNVEDLQMRSRRAATVSLQSVGKRLKVIEVR